MEGFSAKEACRYTNCTPHQLRYWDKIELVKPGVQETGGRPGVRRLYSFNDLVLLRVFKSLLEGGMSLQRVRRAYAYLRRTANIHDRLSSMKLLTDGVTILDLTESGDVVDVLNNGQLVFGRTIEDVAAQVDGRVAHYYDRDALIRALRRMEQTVEEEQRLKKAAGARGRVHAGRTVAVHAATRKPSSTEVS